MSTVAVTPPDISTTTEPYCRPTDTVRLPNGDEIEKMRVHPRTGKVLPPSMFYTRALQPRFSKGKGRCNRSLSRGRTSSRLRVALMSSVDMTDIMAIMMKLVEMAKAGDLGAAKEVLDRTVGKAESSILVARLDELEDRLMRGEVDITKPEDRQLTKEELAKIRDPDVLAKAEADPVGPIGEMMLADSTADVQTDAAPSEGSADVEHCG